MDRPVDADVTRLSASRIHKQLMLYRAQEQSIVSVGMFYGHILAIFVAMPLP